MKKVSTIGLAALFVGALTISASDVNPDEIIKKTLANYGKIKSFKANGVVESVMNMKSRTIKMKTIFKILIEKPNLYKISWLQKNRFSKQKGSVWNAGDGNYLYMGTTNSYFKFKKNEMALGAATGISGGATNTIPQILLLQHASHFEAAKGWKYVQEEKINDESCFVLESGMDTVMYKVWISKSRFLILRDQKDVGNKGDASKLKLTDKQIAGTLKSMGKKATEKNIKKMKAIMEMASKMSKDLKVTLVEEYKNIEIDKSYSKSDFIFTPPDGTVLKKSFFEGVLSMKMPTKLELPKGMLKRKSLAAQEKEYATEGNEKKFYMLSELAKTAFKEKKMEKASKYATLLLIEAAKYKKNWNYGNAIHHGNIILGRIALQAGKMEAAKKYLIKAGNTPGSPQLDSFGPNMTLAEELLNKGEKKSVLEYFKLCGKFWKMDRGRLKSWSSEVKKGEEPCFGANLLY